MSQIDIQSAYAEYDRRDSIANSKVGCVLATILMPAGSFTMDYFMYHDHLWQFFQLRLASGITTAGVFGLLMSRWSTQLYRVLRMAWYWIPMIFIACMIYAARDPQSPYYAGFNLVLIAVAVVLPWTYKEILTTALLISGIYIAIALRSGWGGNYLANNLFFLGCTATIATTGSFFYSRLRLREFIQRSELDANRQKLQESYFFANISHELRTPLTLLIAPLENMMQRFGRSVDEDTRNMFYTMHANGMRLLKLINDLLDLVRLESGVMQVKKEPVSIEDFIRGIASSVRQVADDKRIKLETNVDPELGTALADRDKLEKIVLNLVFNALKFTPAGGRVEIRAEKKAEELLLIISDTGVGISEQNLKNIFSRFWQADDSSRRKYQGVGIGLALVKELAEVQGGSAHVDSIQGKGTTFTIRLPYSKAESADVQKQIEENQIASIHSETTITSQEWLANLYRRAELFPAMTPIQETRKNLENATRNGNRPTVLVADDEPDMLRFLKSQLSPHYNVIEAVNGQQAVDKSGQFLPDIIVLDMMMPEKDGLQACKEIRERTSTATIPIVLLTARADEETKLAALKNGASDFLPKPFSTTELHVRIKNLVESYQYQIKLAKQNQVLETTIDQLKETESQLVQTEKLASLGRMSAGIIHEINNPLNFATTGLFTLKGKGKHIAPEQQEEYADILNDVEEGIKRVRTIVSDLRGFTHHDNAALDHVEVSDVVTSALRFLSHEWRDTVQLEQNLTEHQTIWANKNKLIQICVNLLQNSLDAVRRKQFAVDEKPTVSIESKIENNQSILIIRDNGEGIHPDNLNKIFDPFFTTKDVGEGMGLGLSITYRIVKEYDGRIDVRSEPGKFTEIRLEFPLKGEVATSEPKAA
jgi:signal transduction histidine kinase